MIGRLTKTLRRRWSLPTLIAMLATLLTLGGSALADFSDVGPSNPYHDDVEWVSNRAITGGCGGSNYCPDATVTRKQMAAFLHREGKVLTPTVLSENDSPGAIATTLDACQIPYTAAAYAQQAVLQADASVLADGAGPFTFGVYPSYSTNGGSSFGSAVSWFSFATAATSSWASGSASGTLDLTPGQAYIFATSIQDSGGAGDDSDRRCHLTVTIYNRNPATSPLSAVPAPGSDATR